MSYDKNSERFEAQKYADQVGRAQREDSSALNGMTLGILLVLALVGAATAFYLLNRRDETVPIPVVVPSSSAAPEKTIIREEKTREIVPVPQATSQPSQPDVNIIVPSNAPSPAAAPSASGNAPSSSSAQSPAPAGLPSSDPSLSSPSSAN